MTSDCERRAATYVAKHSLALLKQLGFGTDGVVWCTNSRTAVKAFNRSRNYRTELGCYQRLTDHAITEIEGFSVPRLEAFDDDLLVLEISIVEPPFILDFGKAYLDHPADFSTEVYNDWEQEQLDRWGEERWRVVQVILLRLQRLGIYYLDPKPGNILFSGD